MPNRHKLFAALLPIAAIGFLTTENIGRTGYAEEPFAAATATTVETTPYGRASSRGARPAPAWPAYPATAAVTETVPQAAHPRRQQARSLPQTGNSFVVTAEEPRLFGARGARS